MNCEMCENQLENEKLKGIIVQMKKDAIMIAKSYELRLHTMEREHAMNMEQISDQVAEMVYQIRLSEKMEQVKIKDYEKTIETLKGVISHQMSEEAEDAREEAQQVARHERELKRQEEINL
jgi:hypothetical protein